jgi:hypothetical protein
MVCIGSNMPPGRVSRPPGHSENQGPVLSVIGMSNFHFLSSDEEKGNWLKHLRGGTTGANLWTWCSVRSQGSYLSCRARHTLPAMTR